MSEDASERERVADELRKIRDEVRERALHERPASEVLPAPAPLRAPATARAEPQPPAAPPIVIARPDVGALGAAVEITRTPADASLKGWLSRWARRALRAVLDAQQAFNSRQARLDQELLDYVDARLAETHRHYDAVLGIHGRHMEDIDTRHLILQEELVAHVHDLVKRIDLVLSDSERGRLSLEFALKDLRERLARLEERLARG